MRYLKKRRRRRRRRRKLACWTRTTTFIMTEHLYLSTENLMTIIRIVNKFELIWNYCSLHWTPAIVHAKLYSFMPESVKSEDCFIYRKESLFWEMETSCHSNHEGANVLAPLNLIRLGKELSSPFYLWRIVPFAYTHHDYIWIDIKCTTRKDLMG